LSAAKILSALVTDEQQKQVYGFVDVLDILSCIVDILDKDKGSDMSQIKDLKWEGKTFSNRPTFSVMSTTILIKKNY
jgi:hypothetical protein